MQKFKISTKLVPPVLHCYLWSVSCTWCPHSTGLGSWYVSHSYSMPDTAVLLCLVIALGLPIERPKCEYFALLHIVPNANVNHIQLTLWMLSRSSSRASRCYSLLIDIILLTRQCSTETWMDYNYGTLQSIPVCYFRGCGIITIMKSIVQKKKKQGPGEDKYGSGRMIQVNSIKLHRTGLPTIPHVQRKGYLKAGDKKGAYIYTIVVSVIDLG